MEMGGEMPVFDAHPTPCLVLLWCNVIVQGDFTFGKLRLCAIITALE